MSASAAAGKAVKPQGLGCLHIAIVGAESTGKTTLAEALATRLRADTGLRVAWVPEALRAWCQQAGRTPQVQEQAPLLRRQHEKIDAAAANNDVVVCDTTALMTAVYSRLVFGDPSLEARAVQLHRRIALTLLTAIDLPWQADGLQRDGPQVQAPVDSLLRQLLRQHRLPWALVSGSGPARLENAVDAVSALLQAWAQGPQASTGLFTRLAGRGAQGVDPSWACECGSLNCDLPTCENPRRQA